ncbi:hypothetical protein GCM10010252_27380 [Streptomyces aureoverticillatus]|nr:hypothetical protein GCM10010252_27380 [Streptomyces aureoverticillatus]
MAIAWNCFSGVVDIARSENDRQWQAPAVDGEMDFGGQPAPGPPQGLARLRAARIFQFVPVRDPYSRAPAACWWARLIVESIATVHSTRPTASSRTWTRTLPMGEVGADFAQVYKGAAGTVVAVVLDVAASDPLADGGRADVEYRAAATVSQMIGGGVGDTYVCLRPGTPKAPSAGANGAFE